MDGTKKTGLFQFIDDVSTLRSQIIADLAIVLEKQERWDDADPLHRHVMLTQAEVQRPDLAHLSSSLHVLSKSDTDMTYSAAAFSFL